MDENRTYPPAPAQQAATKESVIDNCLSATNELVTMLEASVNTLGERLQPVLKASPEANSSSVGQVSDTPVSSPLAGRIITINMRLNSTLRAINNISSNLEV